MKDSFNVIKATPGKLLIIELAKVLLLIILTSHLFYDSILAGVLLLPVGYMVMYKSILEAKKREERNISNQFKDGLVAVSNSLSAGYSIENSFKEAVHDLELLYGVNCVMVKEFNTITNKLGMNKTMEDALDELAQKLKDEDARVFAQVFKYAKRSGGDLVRIIRESAKNIEEKQRVKEEIAVMVAAKKFEQKVMNVIPFAIIAYLNLTMPGLLEPLYHNLVGVLIMSAALFVYGVAVIISKKITDIEV